MILPYYNLLCGFLFREDVSPVTEGLRADTRTLPPPASRNVAASASAEATRLAAILVLDAIASDESIDSSVLSVLVDLYSKPLKSAPEATREWVALRLLQKGSSMIAAGGDAEATAARVPSVDGARSCQDVLLSGEAAGSSGKLEKDLLPPFSQDIQEAICTTKPTLPEFYVRLISAMKDLKMEDVLGDAEVEKRLLKMVKDT